MASGEVLQRTIERFWETVPRVWGSVRCVARANATQYFNLNLVQFDILRHIRRGVHSVADLAERQQISRPAISQAVDSLVEKGLVSRTPEAADRRYVRLELTDRGEALVGELFTKNRAWMAEKLNVLSDEELETVIDALLILKKTLDPSIK